MSTLYTTTCFSINYFLALASSLSEEEGTALLFSGGNLDSAVRSILFFFPYEKISLKASALSWKILREKLSFTKEAPPTPEWVGFLGYEMGAFVDEEVILPHSSHELPDALFFRAACVIVYDHKTGKAEIYLGEEGKKSLNSKQLSFIDRIPKRALWEKKELSLSPSNLRSMSSSDTSISYLEKIQRAKEWILEGNIYQINLSQKFSLKGSADPFALFAHLNRLNPAPFSLFLQCGEYAIVSSSPERFLNKRGDLLETRPIKGTAPRGKTEEEDLVNRAALLSSEKERSELLMICDLSRNDLAKISIPGSLRVVDLFRCEAYTNVYHLIAIVQAQQKSGLHPIDLIRTSFPGGSVTGCPKLAAMEGIHALEGRARGIYTGSIGYFAENGDFDFNIAIRTLLVLEDLVELQLGGAITYDSEPLREFEETLYKGESLFKTLGIYEHHFFR